MHELSIAISIVEMAEQESWTRGVQVSAVHLKLGRLSGVAKDALLSSYGIACEGTPLEGSRLVIEDVPVEVYCAACDTNRKPASMPWFICPECGETTPNVIRGKELEVTALEIQ